MIPLFPFSFNRKLYPCTFIIALLFISSVSFSQIGIGVNPPDSSAMLHVQDTAKGLLIPRMTAAHKNAIYHPAEGLMIYQTDEAKGFWYYDGNAWSSVAGNKGGAYEIILRDMTDDQARAKIAAQGGSNTRKITIYRCPNLTTIDLSMFTELAEVNINQNPALQSVDLRNLVTLIGGYGLLIAEDTSLNNLNLSSLKEVISGPNYNATINIGNTKITGFNFPNLEKTNQLSIGGNKFLTSVFLPLLQTANNIYINSDTALVSLGLPSLKSVYNLSITGDTSLVSVSLPVLTTLIPYPNNTYYGTWTIAGNANLTSIDFVPFTTASFLNYSFAANKLNSNDVNNILAKFVAMGPIITGKTINVSGQHPSAPPTGQGLIDKATLISHNNIVTTD